MRRTSRNSNKVADSSLASLPSSPVQHLSSLAQLLSRPGSSTVEAMVNNISSRSSTTRREDTTPSTAKAKVKADSNGTSTTSSRAMAATTVKDTTKGKVCSSLYAYRLFHNSHTKQATHNMARASRLRLRLRLQEHQLLKRPRQLPAHPSLLLRNQ